MTSSLLRPSENFESIVEAMMRDSSQVDRNCCPLPEEIWDACHFESSPAEQRRIILHTASCVACAREWNLANKHAQKVRNVEGDSPLPSATKVLPFPARYRRGIGFVLAAVAAAGIIVLLPRKDTIEVNPESDFRGRQGENPGASTPGYKSERGSFYWPHTKGTKSYNLLIYNRDLDLIKRFGPILSAPFDLEKSIREELSEGGAFYWRIERESKQGVRELSAPMEIDVNFRFKKTN